MKFWVKKTLSGLTPSDRSEFDKLQEAKLRLGEYYEVEIKKKRNSKFHRKLFALINICYENQSLFNSVDELRYYLTIKAGYYNVTDTPKGKFYTPKSIAFSSMDQIEFDDLYDKVFSQVLILLGCDNDDLMEQLKDF